MALPEEERDRAATVAVYLLDEKTTPETFTLTAESDEDTAVEFGGKSKNIIADDQDKVAQNQVRLELQQNRVSDKCLRSKYGKTANQHWRSCSASQND